ncbi:MAG: ribonuclease R [Cytophagales bacterium]|nr:ribonuclease R [Cytophagales bacterium]
MGRNTRKKKSNTGNKIVNQILALLKNNPGQNYNPKQLVRKLKLKGKNRIELVTHSLQFLIEIGDVQEVEKGLYQSTIDESNTFIGKVDHVNPRFAFIICEELEEDIKVSKNFLNGAIHGDTVMVNITRPKSGDSKAEGAILEIVQRGKDELVGTIEISDKFAFVVPDSKKIHGDIFIPKRCINTAHNKDKVIVKVTTWASDGRKAEGKVVKVLGKAGLHDVEMHAIMAEFDLPTSFPKAVIEESEAIPEEISQKEIDKRRDMRDITTFTIDPLDAKDFDDAISIQKQKNGNWEIGVHIADVTHYVRPNTKLEKEAFKRATSVYLVDRVVPMLPERLSNGLCSLRPNEDKLSFSAIFELNENGTVHKEWFGRTIIHSDRRFTYEEAQELIEGNSGDFEEEVRTLNKLAYALREKRFKKGAIGFETPEVRFRLATDGTPLEVVPKERKDAHKLVEDFMLLANKKVAEFVYSRKKEPLTMVYRVHENPNPEKLASFAKFATRFGHSFNPEGSGVSHSLNQLVTDIIGKPEEDVLQQLAIRCMAKARYTTDKLGHFGLAFDHYSHFTSPIRRYPDMIAHRLLQHYLDGKSSADEKKVEEQCKHSSEQERLAAEAERASIKYKQVEFMQNQEQEKVFEGIVSGITEWGIYVEAVETKCEGMVRMADMNDDYYQYDAYNLRVIGERNKRMISFGDKVKVKILDTNLQLRTIDFEFIWD